MLTIYIHEKPVIICKEETESVRQKITNEQLILLKDPDIERLEMLLHTLEEEAVHGYVWESHDTDALLKGLMQYYEHWQAAGGLIINQSGEILLIFRRGKWDLPKGKLEEEETPEACALREVSEETGLRNIYIEQKLTETWHVYTQFGKNILKQTHWYQMKFTGSELTIPQIEEDIVDIQWIRPENIAKYLSFSYPNIRELFAMAGYRRNK